MANATLDRARGIMAGAEGNPLVILAAGLVLSAGILHFLVAPDHFHEHVAQGLFMAVLGTLQVVWALWFYARPRAGGLAAGLALTLGSLVVWLIAITYRAPFQSDAEPADPIAYTTKAIELLALVALLALPLSRAHLAGGLARALPLVVVILLVGALAGAGAFGAGLVGEQVAPGLGEGAAPMSMGGDAGVTPASTDHGSDTGGMPMGNTSGNSTNTSTPGNGLPPGFDGSNCMGGMDMPGCTARQAEIYFDQQAAAPPPPPDKPLPNVKIDLAQQGPATQKFSLPDAGVKQLLISIRLNSTSTGPYAACDSATPPCQGSITVTLAGKTASGKVTLTNGDMQGVDTGQSAAGPKAEGPWNTAILNPDSGDWTITVDGIGTNAHVDVQITERFFS
ncbi:MAG: hypothetical protein QOE90_1268 [Thermoplasmata archaeon]|jgi:hypothetical protein|nr:hypothetical protein [Thermoplasmata archaeon]